MTAFASLKPFFSRSLAATGGRLHLAAHSHHLWPDASYAGHMAAWQDAATHWDAKWARVFDGLMPAARRHIAGRLNLPDRATIAFAPNTHDFVNRLLSACPPHTPPRVLTTDGEFHSAARQFARLAEERLIVLTTVPTRPFATFAARFAEAARGRFDLVFVSQVFFNSGFVVPDMATLVAAVADPDALVAIDGYHGFMALPTDLAPIAARAFYIAGGYKYAMAGEGVCFMHCPPGVAPAPRDTGWYASFGSLAAARAGSVAYGPDGSRFMGATFDPTGLHRLNAVMGWLESIGLGVAEVQARAHALQHAVMDRLAVHGIDGLQHRDLLVPLDAPLRGNFLAFDSPHAPALQEKLREAGIVTDVRGTVLRMGFGLYHDLADAPAIAERIVAAMR
jgi:selenocysteine lyase/cysteine desulfurase